MTYVTTVKQNGSITLLPYEEHFPPGTLVEIILTCTGSLIVCPNVNPITVEGYYDDRALVAPHTRDAKALRSPRRVGPTVEREPDAL